jgi:hypothetical protein
LEQVAKIVAANSRSIWTEARERSGMLPSGRSLLGSIVDPFGVFRSSPLVNTCEADKKTVETTQKLISLLRTQVSASNENALVDLSDLQQDEVVELAAILGRKVWDRRVSLLKTGNRFATKLLEQTAGRLENVERIRRPLAIRQPVATQENNDDSTSETGSEEKNNGHLEGATVVSSRLTAARNRVEKLTQIVDEQEELDQIVEVEEELTQIVDEEEAVMS